MASHLDTERPVLGKSLRVIISSSKRSVIATELVSGIDSNPCHVQCVSRFVRMSGKDFPCDRCGQSRLSYNYRLDTTVLVP